MSEFRVAYRYALALLSVAEEMRKVEAVSIDFENLEKLVRQNPEFTAFLRSPVVSIEKKKHILREILHQRVSETTYQFVLLLASKGREGVLAEVIKQFFRLRDERQGILNVTTRTAAPFTETQEQ